MKITRNVLLTLAVAAVLVAACAGCNKKADAKSEHPDHPESADVTKKADHPEHPKKADTAKKADYPDHPKKTAAKK